MATTPGVTPDRSVPESEYDICRFCGSKRTEKHLVAVGGPLRCPKQGCPGQHA